MPPAVVTKTSTYTEKDMCWTCIRACAACGQATISVTKHIFYNVLHYVLQKPVEVGHIPFCVLRDNICSPWLHCWWGWKCNWGRWCSSGRWTGPCQQLHSLPPLVADASWSVGVEKITKTNKSYENYCENLIHWKSDKHADLQTSSCPGAPSSSPCCWSAG